MRDVVLLGSTGSVGTQALDVIRRNPSRFRVVGLAAGGGNAELLARQADEFDVPAVAVAHAGAAQALADRIGGRCRVVGGGDAVEQLVRDTPCDVVLNGMTGSVGLAPTLAALEAGRTLALANKESLIVGGPLVLDRLSRPDQLIPVDSEHSALAQCLRGGRQEEVSRLILTASGGPFRGRSAGELANVTVGEALAHPTWDMGPVITVNSATLVNKGLELIEAHLLFGVPYDRIDVVVHPQSIVHSMVEFTDGSTLAQASPPDMRLPIALALGWPDRVPGAQPPLDWSRAQEWQFEPLDAAAFPAVALARRVGTAGGTAPAVFNAANEEAVGAFLERRLSFPRILHTVAAVVDEHLSRTSLGNSLTLADVLSAETWARQRARDLTTRTAAGAAT